MRFVVYLKETTQMVKLYNDAGSAKSAVTRMNKKAGYTGLIAKEGPYASSEEQYYYNNIVAKRTVKSLMTGADVEIDVNTPRCCDPSSELYWTM